MSRQFEFGAITPFRYFFGIAVLLGLLFAIISGSDEDSSFLTTLAIWQLQTIIPMGLLVVCHLLLNQLGVFNHLNPWLSLTISGVLGSIVFTPLNLVIDVVIQGESSQNLVTDLTDEFLAMAPSALISWIAINAPWVLGFRLEKFPGPAHERQEESLADQVQPEFVQLLPPELQGEVVYLKAELHYLTVVTTRGSHLLLYNLRDAIAEFSEGMGFQCHRSYWVNKNFVDSVRREGRQGVIVLKDGATVPVSRTQLKQALELFSP